MLQHVPGTVFSHSLNLWIECGVGNCRDWSWTDISVTGGQTIRSRSGCMTAEHRFSSVVFCMHYVTGTGDFLTRRAVLTISSTFTNSSILVLHSLLGLAPVISVRHTSTTIYTWVFAVTIYVCGNLISMQGCSSLIFVWRLHPCFLVGDVPTSSSVPSTNTWNLPRYPGMPCKITDFLPQRYPRHIVPVNLTKRTETP